MKEIKANLKILKIKRLKNSIYGNPRYYLIAQTKDGEIISGKTATDALIGYEILWTWENDYKIIAYHFTRNGDCIFDRLIN